MHPLSRFPLFVMGMAAGELHVRSPAAAMPWPTCVAFHLFPCACVCGVRNILPRAHLPDDVEYWRYRATSQALRLVVVTAMVVVGSVVAPVNDPLGGFVVKGGCVWYQAIVPFAQAEVIVGLVRDRGTSWAGQVRTRKHTRVRRGWVLCFFLTQLCSFLPPTYTLVPLPRPVFASERRALPGPAVDEHLPDALGRTVLHRVGAQRLATVGVAAGPPVRAGTRPLVNRCGAKTTS